MTLPTAPLPHQCSFCSKPPADGLRLISGPRGVFICAACVQGCAAFVEGAPAAAPQAVPALPRDIGAALDDYIIGHEHAKRVLSVAVYNHRKRTEFADAGFEKSNVLLIGATGTGKTAFARTLARILEVPFAIADATALTEAGYVGEDVENILLHLIRAADGDIERAQRGIIYIDEIDKVARRADNPSTTRDVSGEGVQQALLKIIEGTDATIAARGPNTDTGAEPIQIDTSNILFILGGAFDGLPRIISKRVGTDARTLGFGVNAARATGGAAHALHDLTTDDLLSFGFIPEFLGRVPIVVTLDPLDLDTMVAILTQPRDAVIRQFQYLLALDGVELEVTSAAQRAIAAKAMERGTGARGLRSVVEELLLDVMYEAPDHPSARACVITTDRSGALTRPLLLGAAGFPLAAGHENQAV